MTILEPEISASASRSRLRVGAIGGIWLAVLVIAAVLAGLLVSRHLNENPPLLSLSPGAAAEGALLANSYATWHPTDLAGRSISGWTLTHGSLFVRDRGVWSGTPDAAKPNASSSNGTGSAVFRLYSSDSFDNVELRFDLLNLGFSSAADHPAHSWDGFHVFLRVRSEYSLYVVSVNRRDYTVAVKRKVPDQRGPSNGGVYSYVSKLAPWHFEIGRWQHVKVSAVTNEDGTVTLRLYINGKPLLNATDTGRTDGASPLVGGGRIGIRADNDQFVLRNFGVWRVNRS